MRLQHRCFLVKFAKFFRIPFFTLPIATFETKHASAANLLHTRIGSLCWNESYEKETKHIHALAADLLNIRMEISACAKTDIAKTKQEK